MENTPFTLRPISKQVFQVAPEQSHPRVSLRRVLYVKFLRWVEQASFSTLLRTILKCLTPVVLLLAITAPSFLAGFIIATFKWNSGKIPLFFLILYVTLNAKRLWLLLRKTHVQSRKGNQHTYHGLPLDEFSTYLLKKNSFTTEAIADLGLSQRKWRKIADELEHNGILVRGENNSRVLAQISREELVRQLRDGFPLVFDEVGKVWCEKRGSYERFLLDKERTEEREQEKSERLERKEDRMRKNIARMQKEQTAFQAIMSGIPSNTL